MLHSLITEVFLEMMNDIEFSLQFKAPGSLVEEACERE